MQTHKQLDYLQEQIQHIWQEDSAEWPRLRKETKVEAIGAKP